MVYSPSIHFGACLSISTGLFPVCLYKSIVHRILTVLLACDIFISFSMIALIAFLNYLENNLSIFFFFLGNKWRWRKIEALLSIVTKLVLSFQLTSTSIFDRCHKVVRWEITVLVLFLSNLKTIMWKYCIILTWIHF